MLRTLFLVAVMFGAAGVSAAAGYPSRPVKVVVPWPPGQATDIAARLLAQKLQEAFGQPFVIDNRPGAGGSIGTAIAAKSPADGYTLLAASSGPVSVMPSLQKLPYDPVRDLVMLGLISRSPYVLVVSPSFPAKDAKEFVALLRASPDKYTFGSSGAGATGHLLEELFNSMTGIRARHVPYKGAGPELVDVMNGQVDYAIEVVAATVGHVRAGRLRALGVSTARRAAALMEVPTLQQAAELPDYDMGVWIGLAAPSSLPQEVYERLSREVRKAMASKDLRNRLLGAGLDPVASTPEELQTFIRAEQERYAAVIQSANIRLDP
ncbi:MAG TPA: tripartite tricarboxylate transporter substrate binding protein [Burkholderiales bacterium]|jgi:tripartite-type tricarboxylate transporter receptor subunit TctC